MGYEKIKKTFSARQLFFLKGHQKHRSFSWPYVEQPSKSATASNDLRLDDDIEIEILKLFNNKNLILQKYQKQNSWLYYNSSKDGYI